VLISLIFPPWSKRGFSTVQLKKAREAKRVSTMAKVDLTMWYTKWGNDKRLCVGKYWRNTLSKTEEMIIPKLSQDKGAPWYGTREHRYKNPSFRRRRNRNGRKPAGQQQTGTVVGSGTCYKGPEPRDSRAKTRRSVWRRREALEIMDRGRTVYRPTLKRLPVPATP